MLIYREEKEHPELVKRTLETTLPLDIDIFDINHINKPNDSIKPDIKPDMVRENEDIVLSDAHEIVSTHIVPNEPPMVLASSSSSIPINISTVNTFACPDILDGDVIEV